MRILLVVLLLARGAAAAPCPVHPSWPTQAWPQQLTETAATRAEAIAALEAYAFALEGRDEERRGRRTNGLLIARDGVLLYERYGRGFTAAMPHVTWSVAKSVTSVLTGLAVDKGALALGESICTWFPSLEGEHCAITVQALVELASGLEWREAYENEPYQVSSVLAMLYGTGSANRARFVADHPLQATPGSRFRYSTGDSTLLGGVLDRAMRPRFGEGWAFDLLFDRIGMTSAVFERDRKGTLVGGSWFYATPRDLLRLGHLLLNDGCWEGERYLPEDWVRDSTTVTAAYRDPLERERDVAGRSWWINVPVPEAGVASKPWPSLPDDVYMAMGHWGQRLLVVPSEQVVIVRTGDDRESGVLDHDRLFALALEVAR